MALLDEVKAGTLTAMIARSADFYGPNVGTSVANLLVFERLAALNSSAGAASGESKLDQFLPPCIEIQMPNTN
jgi:hypothetical protein